MALFADPKPVLEIFAKGLLEGEFSAVPFLHLGQGTQDLGGAKAFGRENGVGLADGTTVVGVATGGHGETSSLGILEGTLIVFLEGGGGVEDLQPVHGELVEGAFADSGAGAVVRVSWNGDSPLSVDHGDDLRGRGAFESVGKPDPEAKQVTLRSGDLHAWNDEESVHGFAVFADPSLVPQVAAAVAGIVVGECESMEAPALRGGDKCLGAAASVS